MRRSLILLASTTLVVSGCISSGGGSSQPQTEEAAIEATTKAMRGTFVNRSSDVINFLSEECRASVDTDEIKQAIALGQLFLQSDDYDLNDIQVTGTIKEFSPDAATVEVELVPPPGAPDLGFLTLGNDEVDVIYENGKWVGTDCDFEDSSASSAEDVETELETLGVSATRDDPAPAGLALPVGDGFTVAVTDYTADAAAMIEELGGSEPFIEEGQQIALVAYELAYNGDAEPANLNNVSLQMVGTDGVGISQTSCGNMTNQMYFGNTDVFSGAALELVSCFAAAPSAIPADPVISFEAGFSGRSVFIAPGTAAPSPTSVSGSTGPSPDGDLTEARTSPNALGTAVDIGDGWTMTVNGAQLDADAAITAASEFNDPAPDGKAYVLLDVTLTYDGEEESSSVFSVDINLVGDSNVSADSSCNASSLPDELDQFSDVFTGGSTSGNLCFLADDDDLASLAAYATADIFGEDHEFFALS